VLRKVGAAFVTNPVAPQQRPDDRLALRCTAAYNDTRLFSTTT
jgi:hypothetical protein